MKKKFKDVAIPSVEEKVEETIIEEVPKKLVVRASREVNFRNSEKPNGVICTVTPGTEVEFIREIGEWFEVKLNDGRIGVINNLYLAEVK